MFLRILTALALAPIVIFATLELKTIWFGMGLLMLFCGALAEWSRLTVNTRSGTLFGIALLGGVALLATLSLEYWDDRVIKVICIAMTLFWCWQAWAICRHESALKPSSIEPTLLRTALIKNYGAGILILYGAWSAIVILHQDPRFGPIWVVVLMMVVWAADSFAYFIGRSLGKHKLKPQLSAGKTIEGMIGGVIGAVIFAVIAGVFLLDLDVNGSRFVIWMIAATAAALISVVGDLYQSRLKRLAGVKDSGSLLPGHGGILDRIDGLIAAAPVAVCLLILG